MNSEKWQQIKAIFNEAVELSPAECEAFLNNQNGTSDEILTEVRKLLAAEENKFFEKPLVNVSHLWQEETQQDFTGSKIGDYKILREIGRGGMGVVFEAVRERDDFSQIVALKLLQRGMDSKQMLRRFQHERRILASLEHTNIARLLDGGITEDGLSFLAMEFVDGKPLDQFCEEKNPSINERLRLFLQICAAVSFAHSRLVVHRDLKPSNIFVTANGTIKLLDFGIAKIISPDENLSVQTVTALGMMTPAYASPEQIRGEIVSTSSDIYSLGLILYELLTGVSAYKFPNNRPDEIARIVCEAEPPRPSSVVSGALTTSGKKTNHDEQKTTNNKQNRKSKIENRKSLVGDLDNIVLKALRKDTTRRYASVEQLAEDIKRHLEGLPVTARPDTFSYRLEKFVKRNRIYVMTASLILLTLIGGIAATGWQAYRAEKQRRAAEARFKQVRELASNIVFRYYDEAEKLPNSTALREMFVKDTLDYLDSLAKDENAGAELRAELGKAFLRIGRVQGRPASANLGNTTGAIESYRKGIEILEPLAINSSDANLQSELVSAYTDYAVILNQTGDTLQSAEAFRKMIHVGEKFRLQNPENETLAARLAVGYMFRGDSLPVGFADDENIAAYRKTISICEHLLQKNPDDLRLNAYLNAASEKYAYALIELAKSVHLDEDSTAEKQRLQEAEKLFAQNVERGEKLVRLYPSQVLPPAILAAAQTGYATVLIESGDYARALDAIRKAESFYRASLASDSVSVGQKFEVATVEQRLGTIYFRTGDTKQGEKLFAHAFELLNFLVKQDAENFTYIKFRGEAKFDYAGELLRRGSIEKARQLYKESFDELLAAAQTKDTKFAASLPGLYHEKLGTCALTEATKNKTGSEKAIAEYQQALDIWQQNGARNIQGNLQNEKPIVLERKINRLKAQGK